MNNMPIPDWGTQFSKAEFGDPEMMANRATAFERKIRRRNIIEYVTGILLAGTFGWVGWLTLAEGELFVALGCLVMIAGVGAVMYKLHTVASNEVRSPEVDCRMHMRSQLVRQQRALSTVDRWYIGPLVPGVITCLAAMAEYSARTIGWPAALAGTVMPIVIAGGTFVAVSWLNRKAAKTLTKRINELDQEAA